MLELCVLEPSAPSVDGSINFGWLSGTLLQTQSLQSLLPASGTIQLLLNTGHTWGWQPWELSVICVISSLSCGKAKDHK